MCVCVCTDEPANGYDISRYNKIKNCLSCEIVRHNPTLPDTHIHTLDLWTEDGSVISITVCISGGVLATISFIRRIEGERRDPELWPERQRAEDYGLPRTVTKLRA